MVRTYFSHRRIIDTLGSILTVAAVHFGPHLGLSIFEPASAVGTSSLFESWFEAAATMLGFVLASVTFLSSHVRQPEFKILRDSRSYPELIALFKSALWRLFCLTCFTGAGALIRQEWLPIVSQCLLFLVAYAAFAVAGLIWITLRIVSVPSPG